MSKICILNSVAIDLNIIDFVVLSSTLKALRGKNAEKDEQAGDDCNAH